MNLRMSRRFLSLLLALLSITGYQPAMAADSKDPAIQRGIAGNTRFALELYAQIQDAAGNLFLSPYSISTALAMTSAGARGNTAEQMGRVLHLPLEQSSVHETFAALQIQLGNREAEDEMELRVANGLWVQQDHALLPAFLDLVKKYYEAELRQADFQTDSEAVRQAINAWVEKQTNDKIKELLKPGMLNALTRLVLANAIYFKGSWEHPFEENATRNTTFFLGADRTVAVSMMTQQQSLKYLENETLQILELPYAGNALSMIILLPRQSDGLAAVEKSLSVENLDTWLNGLDRRDVQVYLPRFKTVSAFSLAPALGAMGMTDAFNPKAADFSGIDGTRELFLSSIVHKAFIDVNEQGTEAAAATGAVISVTSLPPPPVVFRADHPFLFLIRENQGGAILFLGRLIDPTDASLHQGS